MDNTQYKSFYILPPLPWVSINAKNAVDVMYLSSCTQSAVCHEMDVSTEARGGHLWPMLAIWRRDQRDSRMAYTHKLLDSYSLSNKTSCQASQARAKKCFFSLWHSSQIW